MKTCLSARDYNGLQVIIYTTYHLEKNERLVVLAALARNGLDVLHLLEAPHLDRLHTTNSKHFTLNINVILHQY